MNRKYHTVDLIEWQYFSAPVGGGILTERVARFSTVHNRGGSVTQNSITRMFYVQAMQLRRRIDLAGGD